MVLGIQISCSMVSTTNMGFNLQYRQVDHQMPGPLVQMAVGEGYVKHPWSQWQKKRPWEQYNFHSPGKRTLPVKVETSTGLVRSTKRGKVCIAKVHVVCRYGSHWHRHTQRSWILVMFWVQTFQSFRIFLPTYGYLVGLPQLPTLWSKFLWSTWPSRASASWLSAGAMDSNRGQLERVSQPTNIGSLLHGARMPRASQQAYFRQILGETCRAVEYLPSVECWGQAPRVSL